MAKKKEEVVRGAEVTSDGSRAINKFRVSDFVMMAIIIILCLTCILPFIHLAAKSISSDAAVVAKRVFLWPKGFTLAAYKSIFVDGGLTYSMIYSVIVTLIFTVLGMVVCTCAAYPRQPVLQVWTRTMHSEIILPTRKSGQCTAIMQFLLSAGSLTRSF